MAPLEQDEPIAAMGAYWSSKRPVSSSELQMLQCLANVAGLTISKIEHKRAKRDLRREETRQELVVSELHHRFRNQLSMIAAIFRQTLRSTDSLEELEKAFSGRLQALARAQTLVTSSGAGILPLRAVLQEQLAAAAEASRVTCRGPDVFVPHDDALDLGLLIHELCTNACKHGALSSEAGRISLEWTVEARQAASELRLCWSERGGPPVAVPETTGFGSQLIHHALRRKSGNAEIRYEPTGVVCEISLPLQGDRDGREAPQARELEAVSR